MAAAKKKPIVERNRNGTERYASKAAQARHEKREPRREARREGERKGR